MLKILLFFATLVTTQEQRTEDEQQTQSQDESETSSLTYNETVVVTASGTEQRLVDAASLVSALTKEELSRSPALVIDDQLRRVPGFSLFRRSSSIYSHPTTQGVSLRGIGPSGASRSLVLWNRIPLNDPFGNWVYWNRLPMTSNRAVEVVRGATSQLYGSSALGGTIQLLPRVATEKTVDARLQIGDRGTYDADIFTSHVTDDWSFVGSSRIFDTEGYVPIRQDERGSVDVATKTRFQTFVGELKRKNFHVGVNLFNEDRSNGTHAQQNNSHIFLFETGYETNSWSLNFYGQSQKFTSAYSRILPGRNREIPFGAKHFPSHGLGGSFTMQRPSGLQWGVDWRFVSWDPDDNIAGNSKKQNFAGIFVQHIFSFSKRTDMLIGGRADFWQNINNHGTFNPRAGLTFRASEKTTVRASLYRGFRAPSLNELYRPFRVGNVLTAANNQLTEEYLWGLESGVDLHPNSSVLFRFNGFYNSLRDPVANVTICAEPTEHPLCNDLFAGAIQRQRQNIGSATIAGLEASAFYSFDKNWSLRAAYLFSHALNDDTNLVLPQVAKQQGTLSIRYDGPFQLTGDLRISDSAFEDDRNQFVLPGYIVLDVSVRVPVSDKFGIYVAAENVTNQEYVVRIEPLDVLGAPRMVHGGIELRLFN